MNLLIGEAMEAILGMGNSILATCRQQLLYQKGFCWVTNTPKMMNIADG